MTFYDETWFENLPVTSKHPSLRDLYTDIKETLAFFPGLSTVMERLLSANVEDRIIEEPLDKFPLFRDDRVRVDEAQSGDQIYHTARVYVAEKGPDWLTRHGRASLLKSRCTTCDAQEVPLSICTCCAKVYCGTGDCHAH